MIAPLSVTGGRAVTLHQLKTWRCPDSFADALPGICALTRVDAVIANVHNLSHFRH